MIYHPLIIVATDISYIIFVMRQRANCSTPRRYVFSVVREKANLHSEGSVWSHMSRRRVCFPSGIPGPITVL